MGKKKKDGATATSVTAQSGMSTDQKIAFFETLTVFYDALQQAESARRRMGYPEEADLIAHWSGELTRVMDSLRGAILKSWMADAQKLKSDIEACTEGVSKSVADLKKDARMADTVVKVIGYAEKVITEGAKLLL